MEFQTLFEDLENKFVGTKYDWMREVNCLGITTIDQKHFVLLAPIIGVDFVAGFDKHNADWMLLALEQVSCLAPLQDLDEELPLLRQQDASLGEFIRGLRRPVRLAIAYSNHEDAAFNLLDCDEKFLVAESKKIIPTQSIRQLRVLGTNTWL